MTIHELHTKADPTGPIKTMRDLWRRAKNHDFYYAMSDDFGVWHRGQTDRDEIVAAARRLGPEAQEMVSKMWGWKMGDLEDMPEEPNDE